MLRFLFWRLLGVLAVLFGMLVLSWLLHGGPGEALRGAGSTAAWTEVLPQLASSSGRGLKTLWNWTVPGGPRLVPVLLLLLGAGTLASLAVRVLARNRRAYVRLVICAYRTDEASAEALVRMFQTLHKRLLRRWWRRLLAGQPSIALEVHHTREGGSNSGAAEVAPLHADFSLSCPRGSVAMVQAALRSAYPNARLAPAERPLAVGPVLLRLKKGSGFIRRVKTLDHFEQEREPPVDRLLTAMGACGEEVFVQIALTPAPASFERLARRAYRDREKRLLRGTDPRRAADGRSMVDAVELRGGLEVQHRPLFFTDLRIVGPRRGTCEQIASELRAESAENRLVERGTTVRQSMLGLYERRVARGEGNPLPSFHKGVFASTELAALWQLPSVGYATVPFARTALPLAPAPPSILRLPPGGGTLCDALGPVSIHVGLRKQNTAVPGAVEQGKSSYLVATVAEDLCRERCAVIVLDPKGDAADAALSLVPAERSCTLLDFARPTCGFNPLDVAAPADVIADYVVAALKNLFTDADIRASSDRYLRNAVIAVIAYDARSTLWDAARLLSVGEEGYAYRRAVAARVRALPEFKEISQFFTAELTAQLADARSMTTAKLDAPVNKLARLLNSASIKQVLLNDSLRVDFDRLIANAEVLVVKGALGAMGAGNTSVLMQLLIGMLDAALARQQDHVPADERVTVALKIDEAPLVLNRGFAETMALKRSAGLETVACWQTDAQWTDREVRDQLDALFAHRVYFATASTREARAAASLTMAEFSDTVRPGVRNLSALGRPDVRLHLPKHHAIASWLTTQGRQAPFVAQTLPLQVDRARVALHAARQAARGGHPRADLRQPHWEEATESAQQVHAAAAPAAALPSGEGREPERTSPGQAPESYSELVQLDRAHSVRWAKRAHAPSGLAPDARDLEMLALVAAMGHVLTTQLHRRFDPDRSITTTQRRLKRLSDAGLLERFQFHRRDGGGVSMCHVATEAGVRILGDGDRDPRPPSARAGGPRGLRQARHEVHVTGWALALAQILGARGSRLRGPAQSVLSPPTRSSGEARLMLAPAELRLPSGRTPHDFLRTDSSGVRREVERFETLRPDATVELVPFSATGEAGELEREPQPRLLDVMLELDDRLASGTGIAKLERYDHFLAGWSAHTRRYGQRREAGVLVVFVCRDRTRARTCARCADGVLSACRAYAGEYPRDWQYPGRQAIAFAAERDAHEGSLLAYRVPPLPPAVRVAAAGGEPGAGELRAQLTDICDMAR